MLRKNITKFSASVILFWFVSAIFSACLAPNAQSNINAANSDREKSGDYQKPQVAGTIDSREITESSGLVASACNANVFWTHNDSGDDAFIFALDRTGKKLATYLVTGAKNQDWEDMATRKEANGECALYVGDIGNNERLKSELTIYKFKEPTITGATDAGKKNPLATEKAQAIKFVYPDFRQDAETLMVHPATGDIYVLSKSLSAAAGIYKLAANYDLNKTNTLEKIGDLTVPAIPNGLLTGGAIAPDGKRVILCDYFNAYEITLPAAAKNFDEIWRQKPLIVELGARDQGEAVTYTPDGKAIYATSEKRNSPLIEVDRK